MLCDFVWLFRLSIVWVEICLFVFADFHSFFFFLLLLINLFLLMCQKSKNYIKSRKSKSLIDIVEFCLKTCFALYLYANGFVHLLAQFVPLHSYHCGRNLKIHVTVVNKSSNLSWIISEWFCWSWDMHRLVPIYLPTLYFLFFIFLLKRALQM